MNPPVDAADHLLTYSVYDILKYHSARVCHGLTKLSMIRMRHESNILQFSGLLLVVALYLKHITYLTHSVFQAATVCEANNYLFIPFPLVIYQSGCISYVWSSVDKVWNEWGSIPQKILPICFFKLTLGVSFLCTIYFIFSVQVCKVHLH